jgi:hypothetical protein
VTPNNAGTIGVVLLVVGAFIGVFGSSVGLRRFLRV